MLETVERAHTTVLRVSAEAEEYNKGNGIDKANIKRTHRRLAPVVADDSDSFLVPICSFQSLRAWHIMLCATRRLSAKYVPEPILEGGHTRW